MNYKKKLYFRYKKFFEQKFLDKFNYENIYLKNFYIVYKINAWINSNIYLPIYHSSFAARFVAIYNLIEISFVIMLLCD